MSSVLVVDDEPRILNLLHSLLKAEGLDVTSEKSGAAAIERLRSQRFDLLVTDIRMSPVDGMEVFRSARVDQPDMPVILLTAYGSVETAIEAMKKGAFDYLTKPFKVDELLITVRRALEYKRALSERDQLRAQLTAAYRFERLVAESPGMRAVCETVRRVAPTDTTVLIVGESGTGKEVVARAIHSTSRRKEKPFVAINCAAIPETLIESELFGHIKGSFTGASANKEGLFETANGGTLFLDEISSLNQGLQGKLLRVLQEHEIRRVGGTNTIPVDVRVLAATNVNLESRVNDGAFRQDLYYRLAVINVEIPPLRERREDILPLALHFLRQETPSSREPPRITREAASILSGYAWPGNVRELENAIKHAMAFAENNEITPDVLPPRVVSQSRAGETAGEGGATDALDRYRSLSLRAFLREKEREYLEQVLAGANGDKERAAKALKISLATLYRKLPAQNGHRPPTES
jgi:DNA-binding NtrC family response regulator